LQDPGIVRNAQKVDSAIGNARALLTVQSEFGSFRAYVWQFVDGAPKRNAWRSVRQIPAQTPESAHMSADMKRRGFTFVGPTICYAFMQAVGMVNDHLVGCFRYRQISPQSK
jgi:DNA-3-methyladenine glycosylase I